MNESRGNWIYLVGGVVLVASGSGVALIANVRGQASEKEAAVRARAVAAGPRVRVAVANKAPTQRRLELQGEARPFANVTLYAKVSGYLKEIRVDKGDTVKPNQILAVIESPELDRQYDAAKADAEYKRANAKRAAALAQPGVVSAREAELESSQAVVADATVAALGTQKSYETLRAPFAGTVTARFVDPGALVQNAANAQTSAQPVVTISDLNRLRIYIYVDQRDASQVHVGDPAEVSLAEETGPPRRGTVTRLSAELDPKTRTMLTEIDLDNRDRRIVPGSFVTVSLLIPSPPALELPVEALILRGKQPFVAVLGSDGTVNYRPVVLAGDDGKSVRVASGLSAGDQVALNLGDTVADGARVTPILPPAAPQGSHAQTRK